MQNKTAKMTPSKQDYSYSWSCSWTCSWTCKSLRGLLLLLCLFQDSFSVCPIKEPSRSTLEIGTEGQYKDLICQVTEQCKVSWLKGDQQLELTDNGTIYCESNCNCHALIFKSLAFKDAGNYTCLAVKGCEGEDLPQLTVLRVDPDEKTVDPVIKQNSECQDKVVYPGEDVTFCCVCQVGQVSKEKPTFTFWSKDDEFFLDNHRDEAAENATSHKPGEELASCITLYNVNKTYAGNYTMVCQTSRSSTTNTLHLKVEVRWWIYVISGMVVLVGIALLAGFVYGTNRIEIRLVCKDTFGTQEKDDGKLYDAYISYYWSDSESSHNPDRRYAMDLKQRLTKLGYTVCLAETDFLPGNETSEEIVQSLTRSRRYIILLSPQFLTYRYMSLETEQCLDIIKQHKKQIIPIFIRDISPDVIRSHVALDHIISTHPRLDWKILEDSSRTQEAPVRTLSMENGNTIELEASVTVRAPPKLKRAEVRVWRTLRLQMPPVPRNGSGCATEEPLSIVETDSLIRHEVSQEDSTDGGNAEAGRMLNLLL